MSSWKDEEEDSPYVLAGVPPPKRSACAERESFCMLLCDCRYSALSVISRMVFSFSFNYRPIFCRAYAEVVLARYSSSLVLLS
jgi:hypothetical protein